MSRPVLPPPPPADELAELARLLAIETPAVLPALLWCIVRSSRAVQAIRTARPSGAHLAMIQSYPAGAALLESFRAGADWSQKWTETGAALDVLLPEPPLPPPKDDQVDR